MKDISIVYNSIVRINTNNMDYDFNNPQIKKKDHGGIGTGFFITNKLIVTCHHVIDTAEKITLTIPYISSNKYNAKILVLCVNLDLAILQIVDYESKFWLKFGNSNNINNLCNVYTVGFPLGSDKIKITNGIISGAENGLIQTDSALNSGNSGGPLLDSSNKVLGIITSVIQNANSIGYVIPINYILIFGKITEKKNIYKECDLLIEYCTTSFDRLQMINNKVISGITIINKSEYSPLKNVNIGDILYKFNNYTIDNYGNISLLDDKDKIFNNMKIESYIVSLIPQNNYSIVYYSFKNNTVINEEIYLDNVYNSGVNTTLVPMFNKLKYINFVGLILLDLTNNLLDSRVGYLIKSHNKGYNKFNNYVVISNIEAKSQFNDFENICASDIIEYLNETKISTLDDIIKFIKTNKSTYINIKTFSKKIETIQTKTLLSYLNYN